MPVRALIDSVSMHCWNGKHRRCTGRVVVPCRAYEADHKPVLGFLGGAELMLACECYECDHPSITQADVDAFLAWEAA